jgi:hypothetical protein
MAIGADRLTALVHSLTALDPSVREDACGTVTDWMGSLDQLEARVLATLLSFAATVETNMSCRESQLHAIYELVDTGYLDSQAIEPLADLDMKSLDVSEREYMSYLNEEFSLG